MRRVLPLILLLVSVSLSAQQIRVAAYNMEGLGEARKDYPALAKVVSNFDVVAAEEVMNSGGLEKVVSALDEGWEAVMSEKSPGPRRLREFFGFLFNDRIEIVKILGAYPPPGDFNRPPFGVQFRLKGTRFAFNLIACHVIDYNSERIRMAEIGRLGEVYRYYEKMTGNRGITIIAGDFNDERAKSFTALLGQGGNNVIPVKTAGNDHMFVSAALKPRVQKADISFGPKTGSSHFPVYVVLKAGGSAGAGGPSWAIPRRHGRWRKSMPGCLLCSRSFQA